MTHTVTINTEDGKQAMFRTEKSPSEIIQMMKNLIHHEKGILDIEQEGVHQLVNLNNFTIITIRGA